MKILVVTQYFWPETFRINDVCLALQERGHEITVLTGKPNYPQGRYFSGYSFFKKRVEYWNGIKIYRASLISRGTGTGKRLFLNYFSFAFFASLRALFMPGRFEKIFVFEPSPITVGIPAIMAGMKFKVPVFFWVQDLWPESITAAGGVTNRFVLGMLNWLTCFIYRRSKLVMVQSKAFIPYIVAQGIAPEKLVYLPNSTENYYRIEPQLPEYERRLPIGFRVLFAGNIGKAQSFDTLLQAATLLSKEQLPIRWIILGDGRMRDQVADSIRELGLEEHFFLLGSFPSTEMSYFFSCADALLVSLQKNRIFSLTIPSKMQSYMACGKPIIASLEGEGGRIVEEADAGLVVPPEDATALAACVKQMFRMQPGRRDEMGRNARTYYEKEFERNKLLDKLEDIFKSE